MTKILVETTGDFQFLDLTSGELVRHEGYTVVDQGGMVPERIANGDLRIVAEVSDEATDAEWLDTVKQSDGDLDLAVASFKSEYPADGVRAEKPAGKTGGFKKKGQTAEADKDAGTAGNPGPASDSFSSSSDADASK